MHATFIGDGPLLGQLRRAVSEAGLGGLVTVAGSLPNDEVLGRMRTASWFVASSSYREGWGAVVNEAMSSGLAVCASSAMGSVPYLIRDGVNGFSYRYRDVGTLAECLRRLTQDDALTARIQAEARRTMVEEWAPDVAAMRLVSLSESLLSGNHGTLWPDGPCSRAVRLNPRNYW